MALSIHLHYVAMLKDRIGFSRETVQTNAADLAELYGEIAGRYQLPWATASLRPAVNDRISTWSQPLSDGDHVMFLPPPSGG